MISENVPCRACSSAVPIALDCGREPSTNRYFSEPVCNPELWPKKIGYCHNCGLVQILTPAPAEALTTNVDWLRFNEPEEHLVKLARSLAEIVGNASIGSLSLKDDSLMDALKQQGCNPVWGTPFGSKQDDKINRFPMIQARLSREDVSLKEPVKLLVGRHILEHVHDLHGFFANVHKLIDDDGHFFIEVPDCLPEFQSKDYARLWSEHTQYFTEDSLETLLNYFGFDVSWKNKAETAQESLLLFLCKKSEQSVNPVSIVSPQLTVELDDYANSFDGIRLEVQRKILSFKEDGQIAMLGTSHLGLSFLHNMGISHMVDVLIDDHPNKTNLYVPGLSSPISQSDALKNKEISLCLLAVNPTIEEIIVGNNKFFTESGVFRSIFPNSRRYILTK